MGFKNFIDIIKKRGTGFKHFCTRSNLAVTPFFYKMKDLGIHNIYLGYWGNY